jgi:pyroglutamyl-peptidase
MRSIVAVALATLAACATEVAPEDARPNEGMFRDFVDGKFDGAGHPFNARVIDASACGGGCALALDGAAQRGELTVSVRARVHALDDALVIRIVDGDGNVSAEERITADRVRVSGEWIDLALSYWSDGAPRTIEIVPGGEIDVDYVEVFPRRFGLVLSPGSGVLADDEAITIEVPLGEALDRVELDGVDVARSFVDRTDTAFRTLYTATGLPPGDLRVRAAGEAARMQRLREPASCAFEGDPAGTKVLVTGFQPFPADGWHDNVSEVAVRAIDPSRLRGVRVMRLVLPVEYDRAAALVRDAIERCSPDAAISFGQGGGAIALEETAYNLKDTGEVAGGVPDNRGVIAAALPIDPLAPPERATGLPLARIERALEAIGEAPQHSDDPGRYICNNVFFVETGALPRAGFVHLPYTTSFDASTRARWGRVAETAVQALSDP